MLAMQYTIGLAGDFDSDRVRQRVAERCELFDTMRGLTHKSFLFNYRDGIYAPFYIWDSHEAAREFLLDEVFKAVIETFGRPRVRIWNILSYECSDPMITPTFAVREVDAVAAEEDLAKLAEEERRAHAAIIGHPGLYSHAVALDADRWELVRYSLWRDAERAANPDADCVQTYEVLHLSIPQGRH